MIRPTPLLIVAWAGLFYWLVWQGAKPAIQHVLSLF